MSISLGSLNDKDQQLIDVDSLVETRMLVQANSGGGKSWALRRLLEQTAKGVQQLVIDPEGEFQTLREKFDFVICAPHDADAVASPQTAALLARRLLEAGVSAILDIYDLKAHERQTFVKRFLESLINAPKSLWHPVLIVLDEAHIFAPQAGGAEAMGAVIDLATRGRKRGQCLIAATQRLAKLHKDVAAELLNKLIGRTGLDVDVKRAAEELGMTPNNATAYLRALDPGQFYCFGPALSRTVQRVEIGQVQTTHPKTGQRLMKAPPAPSAKILGTLAKLADLPGQAEEEAKDLAAYKKANADLKRENDRLKSNGGADPAAIDKAVNEANIFWTKRVNEVSGEMDFLRGALGILRKRLGEIGELASLEADFETALRDRQSKLAPKPAAKSEAQRLIDEKPIIRTEHNRILRSSTALPGDVDGPTQKILNALAWWEAIGQDEPEIGQVALVAGYAAGGGSFKEYLSRCARAGLIEKRAGFSKLTDAGRRIARSDGASPSLEEFHSRILRVVKEGPLIKILQSVIDAGGRELSSEEIGQATGYESSGGSFKEYLGRVKRWGFVERRGGMIRPTSLLFPVGLK